MVDPKIALYEYDLVLTKWGDLPSNVDFPIVAVFHDEYVKKPMRDLLSKLKQGGIFVDVKSICDPVLVQAEGYRSWRL